MRFIVALLLGFVVQGGWADTLIKVVDQHNKPVADAVVSLLDHRVATPKALAKMDQIHIQFSPHVLVIQKGQEVSFPNSDDFRHQVYSFSAPKIFEIKLYKGTESKPILFDEPGLVVLGCNIHDGMIGYIYIANNVFAAKTNDQGEVRVPGKKGDNVTIWSERFIQSDDAKVTHSLTGQAEQTISLELLPPVKLEMQMDMNDESAAARFGKTF